MLGFQSLGGASNGRRMGRSALFAEAFPSLPPPHVPIWLLIVQSNSIWPGPPLKNFSPRPPQPALLASAHRGLHRATGGSVPPNLRS